MLVYHTRSCVHMQTFVGYNRSKAMLGVSARDFVTVAHYRVLPDGRIAVFATHSVHPACPEVKGGYGGLCVCTCLHRADESLAVVWGREPTPQRLCIALSLLHHVRIYRRHTASARPPTLAYVHP
jgi:hypothetical protein